MFYLLMDNKSLWRKEPVSTHSSNFLTLHSKPRKEKEKSLKGFDIREPFFAGMNKQSQTNSHLIFMMLVDQTSSPCSSHPFWTDKILWGAHTCLNQTGYFLLGNLVHTSCAIMESRNGFHSLQNKCTPLLRTPSNLSSKPTNGWTFLGWRAIDQAGLCVCDFSWCRKLERQRLVSLWAKLKSVAWGSPWESNEEERSMGVLMLWASLS